MERSNQHEIKVITPDGWKVRSFCLHVDVPDANDNNEGGYTTTHYHLDGDVAYTSESSSLVTEEDEEDDDDETESEEDPTN